MQAIQKKFKISFSFSIVLTLLVAPGVDGYLVTARYTLGSVRGGGVERERSRSLGIDFLVRVVERMLIGLPKGNVLQRMLHYRPFGRQVNGAPFYKLTGHLCPPPRKWSGKGPYYQTLLQSPTIGPTPKELRHTTISSLPKPLFPPSHAACQQPNYITILYSLSHFVAFLLSSTVRKKHAPATVQMDKKRWVWLGY